MITVTRFPVKLLDLSTSTSPWEQGLGAAMLIICLLLLFHCGFVSYFRSSAMEVKNYYLNSKQIFV